jgi:hypothetical protein
MPEPKKYRRVYADKEQRMYSNDPMRQQIASKYNEPVVPIEEVVVTPKYRTLPQNRFFRRPGETEQQYYGRMASQESITPYFPEKEIIAAELIGGLASKVAPRFSSRLGSAEKAPVSEADKEWYRGLVKELEKRGMEPTPENVRKYLLVGRKLSKLQNAKVYLKALSQKFGKIYGGTLNPMPYTLRDENNQFEALK